MRLGTNDGAQLMSAFAPVLRKRETVRGLILTPEAELLLIHLVLPDRDLWITRAGASRPASRKKWRFAAS